MLTLTPLRTLSHLPTGAHRLFTVASAAARRTMTSTSTSSPPRPIVLCGPSGVGKSTLIKKLFQEFPDRFGFSVSHTTRSPREGERDGTSYHFVTRSQFDDLVAKGAFLEHAQFSGNLYGTSAQAVRDVAVRKGSSGEEEQTGKVALLDIDAQGVRLIKTNHSSLGAFYIFLSPPSFSSLRVRLSGRGTESAESLTARLSAAANEMGYARTGAFDRVVVNDDLERAYKTLRDIIVAVVDGKKAPEGDKLPAQEVGEVEYKEAAEP